MNHLRGKVVIVTGASSGLGAAAARRMATEGAKIVLAARRRDLGEAVAEEVKQLGGDSLFIETDVTRRPDVEVMVEKTITHFGRLDAAVNNAGIGGPAMTPLADVEEEGFDAVMNVNLRAVWLCMKYEIRAMLGAGGGSIVNVSSIYGYKPSDLGHAPYCASKHAVLGLTKSAAVDYAGQGIRVNAVCPGFMHSETVDAAAEAMPEFVAGLAKRHSAMGRLGESAETAEAIAWLCSDASSFVNGAAVPVDGGATGRLY
ncbi:MAG: glucose 1-dehydrogenase [Bryobacteraceae bacterium]